MDEKMAFYRQQGPYQCKTFLHHLHVAHQAATPSISVRLLFHD